MEQRQIGIIIGITFIILGLMLQPASAGDGREPAMCSAVFVTAMDQYVAQAVEQTASGEDNTKATLYVEHYSALVKLFNWKRVRDNINLAAYTHQVKFYMKNMNTATALLHYDRCFKEAVEIYGEWSLSKFK